MTAKVLPRGLLFQAILVILVIWTRLTEPAYYFDDDEEVSGFCNGAC